MAQQQYDLQMPYGIGFTLVDWIRNLNVETMTIETEWAAKLGLQLHLADHFPREKGGKPFYPGVMQIERMAEGSGLTSFRLAEIQNAAFSGKLDPGEILVACTRAELGREHEVEPCRYQVLGQITGPVKMASQAVLFLEAVEEETTFLDPLDRRIPPAFQYAGDEILRPRGVNLPNSVLCEHMCQSVVAMNAYIPAFEGKQFLLTGIPEAKFFSDVPWGATVVSRGKIELDADDPKKRRGTAHVETYLDDAPIAMVEMAFAALPMKKVAA